MTFTRFHRPPHRFGFLLLVASTFLFCLSIGHATPQLTRPELKPKTRISPPTITQGEQNVRREMPLARELWGEGPTDKLCAEFEDMCRRFEQPGGFQSEAQMEAARRVLGIPEEMMDLFVDEGYGKEPPSIPTIRTRTTILLA